MGRTRVRVFASCSSGFHLCKTSLAGMFLQHKHEWLVSDRFEFSSSSRISDRHWAIGFSLSLDKAWPHRKEHRMTGHIYTALIRSPSIADAITPQNSSHIAIQHCFVPLDGIKHNGDFLDKVPWKQIFKGSPLRGQTWDVWVQDMGRLQLTVDVIIQIQIWLQEYRYKYFFGYTILHITLYPWAFVFVSNIFSVCQRQTLDTF